MTDSKDTNTTHDVMARLLAQKKAAGTSTPKHAELNAKANINPRGQTSIKPQRPGGNRGRG